MIDMSRSAGPMQDAQTTSHDSDTGGSVPCSIGLEATNEINAHEPNVVELVAERGIAACILLATSPIIAGAAAAIYAEDRSNPFFLQQRVGMDQQAFTLLKLRTMRTETPHRVSHEISADSCTSIGRRLRRWKIDELPQLVNVVKGEMRLVGPRPGLASDETLTAAREAKGVFNALPGITGLSQLRGIDMSEPSRLADSDAEYLRSRSVMGDIRILVNTALGKGSGDAVGAN